MGKVLALLGVVAVAALGWALWPASPPSATSTPAKKGEAAATGAAAQAEAPAAAAEPKAAQPARVPKAPDPAEGVAVVPVVPAAAAPPPPPVPALAQPAGEVPPTNGGLARPSDSPMPKARYADVKGHMRRFYGSLPANGRVPQPLYAEDLLPPALLANFNVPPRSTLKMVSHYPATEAAGIKEILEMNESGTNAVGFTFVTPDGREVRDYAFLEP